MTDTEKRPRPEVAAAAARAAIAIREYDGREVPDWLRAVAAARTSRHLRTDRSRVSPSTRGAARAAE